MISITRDLIEYYGISNSLPISSNSFTQYNKEDELVLPVQKPDIEQIVKVYCEAKIVNTALIKTPRGKSLEGLILTGYKLLVEGEIKQKIQYVSCHSNQAIHTANFLSTFISFIVLPDTFTPSSYVTPSAFIEDISASLSSPRCIYTNITLLLNADVC